MKKKFMDKVVYTTSNRYFNISNKLKNAERYLTSLVQNVLSEVFIKENISLIFESVILFNNPEYTYSTRYHTDDFIDDYSLSSSTIYNLFLKTVESLKQNGEITKEYKIIKSNFLEEDRVIIYTEFYNDKYSKAIFLTKIEIDNQELVLSNYCISGYGDELYSNFLLSSVINLAGTKASYISGTRRRITIHDIGYKSDQLLLKKALFSLSKTAKSRLFNNRLVTKYALDIDITNADVIITMQ